MKMPVEVKIKVKLTKLTSFLTTKLLYNLFLFLTNQTIIGTAQV